MNIGGKFTTTMSAKDKSASFDFSGIYINIIPYKLIEYKLEDDRRVKVEFLITSEGIEVKETFDMEAEDSDELQRNGWQAILENFRKHVEKEK